MRSLILVVLLALPARCAEYHTANFDVSAPDARLAERIGILAEDYRSNLAKDWLGSECPPWIDKCRVIAKIDEHAEGNTSFYLRGGNLHEWKMVIQGSERQLLHSVLPHEVMHTIMATRFRKWLPLWLNEGVSCCVEAPSDLRNIDNKLDRFLSIGAVIRFPDIMYTMEYPKSETEKDLLYAQGHSMCQWLIEQYGQDKLIQFAESGFKDYDWQRAARETYGFASLNQMQSEWDNWVRRPKNL